MAAFYYMAEWVANKLSAMTGWGAKAKNTEITVYVTTGDKIGAGTDANVWLIIEDSKGKRSNKIKLNRPLANDHERGKTDPFPQPQLSDYDEIVLIEFGRDNFGLGGKWFVDKIRVENKGKDYVFPVQRWIKAHRRYRLRLHDCCLPADSVDPEIRREELEEKRILYAYRQVIPGGPAQIASLPEDEKFHEDYFLDFVKEKLKLLTRAKGITMISGKIESLSDMNNMYTLSRNLHEPKSSTHWRSDRWFGLQRVQGVNPVMLRLCKEIPEKLDVTPEMLNPILNDMSLEEAMEKNRLFIVDLHQLEGIFHHPNRPLVEPICLLYRDKRDYLMPVAIQLHQQKGPENPVFLPTDPPYTWILAKIWYNLGDAQFHQCVTHLGLTHLLMEGVCIATHRNLSPSHPVFRLLAPHFLYLLAINYRGLEKLVAPGEWVDKCMTVQREGMFQLIVKAMNKYHMMNQGNVRNEITSRGLMDPEVLPHYPYRDDAVALFDIIHDYVEAIVTHHYDTDSKVVQDEELQAWRRELSACRNTLKGVGLNGVPGDDYNGFTEVKEVVDTVTVIVSTCSLGHAAANFQQYEAYSYVANFPGMLTGEPPQDKRVRTEEDILSILPDKKTILDIMVITKLLSMQGTKRLGDFEIDYMYDDVSLEARKRFQERLIELGDYIKERNSTLDHPYSYLDPTQCVPNAISI